MLLPIVIAVAAVVVILLGIIAAQPSGYRVTRTTTINAPPATVFALVNDFHRWGAWSPWEKIDPAMTRGYQGSQNGAGAIYTWSGNKQAGEGKMTIAESRPSDAIRIQLDFTRPFPSTSQLSFSFKTAGAGTAVEWTMTGESNFMAKGFFLFTGGMDKAVGPDFTKGLAQMKAAAEQPA
jgi:hypothetical protein